MLLVERTDLGLKNYIEVYEEDDYRYIVTFEEPRTHVEAVSKYPYRPSVSMIDGGAASVFFESGPFSEEMIDEYIERLNTAKYVIKRIREEFFPGW